MIRLRIFLNVFSRERLSGLQYSRCDLISFMIFMSMLFLVDIFGLLCCATSIVSDDGEKHILRSASRKDGIFLRDSVSSGVIIATGSGLRGKSVCVNSLLHAINHKSL